MPLGIEPFHHPEEHPAEKPVERVPNGQNEHLESELMPVIPLPGTGRSRMVLLVLFDHDVHPHAEAAVGRMRTHARDIVRAIEPNAPLVPWSVIAITDLQDVFSIRGDEGDVRD
jgi:hypothetical protein